MPDEDFDSIDAIEKHFGKLRKQNADDDDKVKELQMAEREAKADFRERSALARELAAHRKTALAEIPEDFHEFVTGATPEEIDASAKKVKERIDKLTAASNSDDDAAKRLYGNAGYNGGGTPPGAKPSADEEWIADFQKRFDDPSSQFTVQEVQRYAEKLGGAKLFHNMARVSQKFRDAGITPEVVAEYEAGKLKQQRPQKSGVTLAPRA